MRNLQLVSNHEYDILGFLDDKKLKKVLKVAVDNFSDHVYVFTGDKVHILDANRKPTSSHEMPPEFDLNVNLVFFDVLFDNMQLYMMGSDGQILTLEQTEIVSVGNMAGGISCAEWSPDLSVLVLLTEQNTLLLLDRQFEPIVPEQDIGSAVPQDELVSIGWGKKETQFQGSAGRQAAFLKPEARTRIWSWDDGRPRVTWRADGQFFCTSTVDVTSEERVLRVWTCDGVYSSTLQPVAGLAPVCSWRPSGNWICCSAFREQQHQIVIFEKNGEIRQNFTLKYLDVDNEEGRVEQMCWNRDSSILCVHWTDNQQHVLDMFTCTNYHWYRKQRWYRSHAPVLVQWHSEHANQLMVCDVQGVFNVLTLSHTTHQHKATLAVIDAESVLVTDMSIGCVPPPMCARTVLTGWAVHSVVFSAKGGLLVMCADGLRAIYCHTPSRTDNDGDIVHLDTDKRLVLGLHAVYMTHTQSDTDYICTAHYKHNALLLFAVHLHKQCIQLSNTIDMAWPVTNILHSAAHGLLIQDDKACWHTMCTNGAVSEWQSRTLMDVGGQPVRLPECIAHCVCCLVQDTALIVALTTNNQLFVNNAQLGSNVNSFVLHDSFLLLSVLSHRLIVLPVCDLLNTDCALSAYESRSIEHGARLVTVVPSGTRLVLQMPRGNLEVIEPRQLLLANIRQHIDNERYDLAFTTMKKHRINLNLLHQYKPEQFMDSLPLFIEQLKTVTNLNIFISDLKDDAGVSGVSGAVHRVCAAVVQSLLHLPTTQLHVFSTALLNAYMRHTPPKLHEALIRLCDNLQYLVNNKLNVLYLECASGVLDDGLRELSYRLDEHSLFTSALGTYNMQLAVLVAERTNMDPKEYLPVLNQLQHSDTITFKCNVDCHLQRYTQAVDHILTHSHITPEHWERCLQLLDKHKLYAHALGVLQTGSDKFIEVSALYARVLMQLGQYASAAVVCECAGDCLGVMQAADKDNQWQLWITALSQLPHSQAHTIDQTLTLTAMLNRLQSRSLWTQATPLAIYLQKYDVAVVCLCAALQFSRALQLCTQHGLDTNSAHTALLAHSTNLCTQLIQLHDNMLNHANRLTQLRDTKQTQLHRWIQQGEPDWLVDAELYSEASSMASKSSSASASSQRSVMKRQSRRDAAKRKASTKHGSKWEDLALLQALANAMHLLNQLHNDVRSVLPVLVVHAPNECAQLHSHMHQAVHTANALLTQVWPTKWMAHQLPGPLEELYMDADEQLQLPVSATDLPQQITFDPCMARPVLTSAGWCTPLIHDRWPWSPNSHHAKSCYL